MLCLRTLGLTRENKRGLVANRPRWLRVRQPQRSCLEFLPRRKRWDRNRRWLSGEERTIGRSQRLGELRELRKLVQMTERSFREAGSKDPGCGAPARTRKHFETTRRSRISSQPRDQA